MACIRLAVRWNGMHWIGREIKRHQFDCLWDQMACIRLAVRSNAMHWIGREVKWHTLKWLWDQMARISLVLRSNGMHWIGCENKWNALDHNEGLRIVKATFENDNHIQTRSYLLSWYFLPNAMFPTIRWFPCRFTETEAVKERLRFSWSTLNLLHFAVINWNGTYGYRWENKSHHGFMYLDTTKFAQSSLYW